MQLARPGWLAALLTEAVKAHSPLVAPAAVESAQLLVSGRARSRFYLRRILRESGLLYGTPKAPLTQAKGGGAEERLLLAVLRTFANVALDIAALLGVEQVRPEEVLLLFAALGGQLEEAQEIHRRAKSPSGAVTAKLWRAVEASLEERAVSLAGDPYYGLVLHNGALYADAQLFGRLAIDYFARRDFSLEAAERRLRFFARLKVVLVEVLTALVCAERKPSYPSRRAILRQIEDLRLPKDLARQLKATVASAFERRPALKSMLAEVRSAEVRRFILEQTLLASLADGRRSKREADFLDELACQLGFSTGERQRIEFEMADFYAKHRDVVDAFTISRGAQVMGEEMLDTAERALRKNFKRLLAEVRETGELSVFLARLARGQTLTADERRRMRAQLIDVAKAIPALAIFAAPGGVLLLIALAKVLPFDLMPSAFREHGSETED